MPRFTFLPFVLFLGAWGICPGGAAAEERAAGVKATAGEIKQAEVLARDLAALWADPAAAEGLEPVGSVFLLMQRRDLPAVAAVDRSLDPDRAWSALVEALLARGDRMSVRAALVWMLWKDDAVWLDRALALFPDDPEILLTHAMKLPASPGARERFLRGLSLAERMASFQGTGGYLWDNQPSGGWWTDPEVVMALAGKAEEMPPGSFPEAWSWPLRMALGKPEQLKHLTQPEKLTRALLRHLSPFPEKLYDFPWPWILSGLKANQHADPARSCALELLQVPVGPLFAYPQEPNRLTPLWRHDEHGSKWTLSASFGWQLLKLAAADRPAELSAALKAALTLRPADEVLAFHAFLAQGMEQTLTVSDLDLLRGLPAENQRRLLVCATRLLPVSQFPATLWSGAVADEIRQLLSAPEPPADSSWQDHLRHNLKLIQTPEAAPALARLMPFLQQEQSRLPDLPLPRVMGAMLRALPPEDRIAFVKAWEFETIQGQPDDAPLKALDLLLKAHLAMAGTGEIPELPQGPVRRVSEILSGPAPPSTSPDAQTAFASLCLTALHFPAWQADVRRLAAQETEGEGWNAIHQLIEVMDEVLDPPGIALEFQAGEPGQGMLTWNFSEGGVPAVAWSSNGTPLQNPLLAAAVSRQFEIVISMDDGYGSPARPLRRVKPIPLSGSVPLTNLFNTGKLTFQLVSKTPGAAGASQRLHFNTLPPVLRTEGKLPALPAPGGLVLLAPPVPRRDHEAWQISIDPLPPPAGESSGFKLVLLDAAGRLHSIADLHFHQQDPDTLDSPAGIICERRFMRLGHAWKTPNTDDHFTVAGPAVSLALMAASNDLSDLPRITVRPLPYPLPPTDQEIRQQAFAKEIGMEPEVLPDSSGRLEPVRIWTPGPDLTGPFYCGENPEKTVFFRENILLVLNPLRDDPPTLFPLPLQEPHKVRTGAWLGGKLWLVLHRASTQSGEPDVTTLMAVDPFRPGFPAEIHVQPGILVEANNFAGNLDGIKGLVLEHYHTGIDTIITESGNILTLPAAIRRGRVFPVSQALSPTRLAALKGADGLTPVLDWTSGALSLTFHPDTPEPAWPPTQFPVWQDISTYVGRHGFQAEYTDETGPWHLWEQSLRLDSIWPLTENYLLGTMDGSLVRLRKMRSGSVTGN